MAYRVVGISEAAVGWALNDGDIVEGGHPAFRHDPDKLARYLRAGYLVEIETAMVEPPQNAMRPRGRPRRQR